MENFVQNMIKFQNDNSSREVITEKAQQNI